MSIYLVDTHCHLDLFKEIQTNVRAEDELPIKTITVTNSPAFYVPNANLFRACKNIRVGLGLHPELINQFGSQLRIFEKEVSTSRFIGEIGLDGSKGHLNSYSAQVSAFRSILTYVEKADNKILTVHSRNAAKDVIQYLKHHLKDSHCKVILHWYTGNAAELLRAVEYGFYFSVNHKMLQSNKSRELIKLIPIDRLLTETDAPFTFDNIIKDRLSSINAAIKGISAITGIEESEIKSHIYNNFKHLLS